MPLAKLNGALIAKSGALADTCDCCGCQPVTITSTISGFAAETDCFCTSLEPLYDIDYTEINGSYSTAIEQPDAPCTSVASWGDDLNYCEEWAFVISITQNESGLWDFTLTLTIQQGPGTGVRQQVITHTDADILDTFTDTFTFTNVCGSPTITIETELT